MPRGAIKQMFNVHLVHFMGSHHSHVIRVIPLLSDVQINTHAWLRGYSFGKVFRGQGNRL